MGKVFSSIFGGSEQKSQSNQYNRSYEDISNAFGGLTGAASGAGQSIAALLGGDATGFNKYKQATGFDATAEAGSRGITGNAAASGLLRSGSTGKGLQAYGNMLQNQASSSYLDKLLGLGGMGLQAGSLISGAGNVGQSNSSGYEKPGIGKFLGSIAAGAAASDRRLKDNIKHIYTMPDGLKAYQFTYKGSDDKHIGVMADEVAVLRPEALGPIVDGYATVNYDKIWRK